MRPEIDRRSASDTQRCFPWRLGPVHRSCRIIAASTSSILRIIAPTIFHEDTKGTKDTKMALIGRNIAYFGRFAPGDHNGADGDIAIAIRDVDGRAQSWPDVHRALAAVPVRAAIRPCEVS